jgi:photosystem II stability/assembly factor-like uncharacterized protein
MAATAKGKRSLTRHWRPSKGNLVAGAAVVAIVIAAIVDWSKPNNDVVSLGDLKTRTHYHGLAVDRADSSRLLLATHHGFFVVSTNGMATRISPVQDFMGFTAHPSEPAILYASGHPAGGGNLGFIKSDDGGATWTQVSRGLGGPVDFHQMDVSPADPNVVYGSFVGIQVSRDGGRSWTMSGAAPEGLVALAASRANADWVYAATRSGLWLSRDAGKSWAEIAFPGQPVSLVSVGPGSSILVFVVGKGLMQAKEETFTNWTRVSNGLGDRVLLHLAVDSRDPSRMYATTQDNDLLASADGGRSWRPYGAQ